MFWYKYALTLHRKCCIKHTYAKKVLFIGNSNLSILYFIWPYPQISCCSSLLCIFFFVFVTNTLCCWCLVPQSCPTLCHPMDCNTLGLPVLHCLLELAQTHAHLISDVKQSSYPLSSPSPPNFYLSQHQGLFQWVGSLYLHIRWPKYYSFSFSISLSNEYSGLISLGLIALISLLSKGLFKYSWTPQFESINSSVLSLLYGPTLTFMYLYNLSFVPPPEWNLFERKILIDFLITVSPVPETVLTVENQIFKNEWIFKLLNHIWDTHSVQGNRNTIWHSLLLFMPATTFCDRNYYISTLADLEFWI